jgi:hypothetical protein
MLIACWSFLATANVKLLLLLEKKTEQKHKITHPHQALSTAS